MTQQSPNTTQPDYRTRIQSGDYHLSPAYRLVCDYIMRNYVIAAMSTAADIAAAVNVDTATVVRCAQALGYKGWPELQAQLMQHALSDYRHYFGAGIANYTDALRSWLRYVELNSQSAQHPSNTNLAIDAACAYAEAIHLTDYCLR